MQALLNKVLPSRLKEQQLEDNDSRGFDLADSLEDGESHEMMLELFKACTTGGLFILRRSSSTNDWTMITHRSAEFVMHASVDVELDKKFEHDFDSKVLASYNMPAARMRVGVYLSNPRTESGPTNPAVVMISDASRLNWRAYKVLCDSCRYKRRRSSFTEGSECGSPSCRAQDTGGACSFRVLSQASDFGGISSVTPSGQCILQMSHVQMQIHGSAFTKLKVTVPAQGNDWCPVAHPNILTERTNTPDITVESRVPVWSERLEALALEFKQRDVLPSRRNFQLIVPGSAEPVCMHYRTGKNEYTLELFPGCGLSLMQAFSVAISSSLWQ